MSTRLQVAIALVAIGITTVAITRNAEACGLSNGQSWASTHWSLPQSTQPSITSQATAVPQQSAASSINPLQILEPITGMYQFTFVAKGNKTVPDGTQLDEGFAVWHADGTEIMNSGKSPVSQSFCMGVWTSTGARSYKLNHWALNWDATGTIFLGPVNIRENITLDATGNTYKGNFTLTQYSPDGNTAEGGVQGVVSAIRITAN